MKDKEEKKNEELQQLESEFVAVDIQCNYLEQTSLSLVSKLAEYTKKVEEKNQMVFLTKGNALK